MNSYSIWKFQRNAKRVLAISVLAIITISIWLYFLSQPKTVEDFLDRGFAVPIDDFSNSANLESDHCRNFDDSGVSEESLIERMATVLDGVKKDFINWQPFLYGEEGGGERTIFFLSLAWDGDVEPPKGNYSVDVNDKKMLLNVDEACYSDQGSYFFFSYRLNRKYDLSNVTQINFTVTELKENFKIHFAFSENEAERRDVNRVEEYEISSMGKHSISLLGENGEPLFDLSSIDRISLTFSGYGVLEITQPELVS